LAASVKLYIIQFGIKVFKKIILKLLYLQAKYEADDYAINNDKIDMRNISSRFKNILLHDQDIIDKRWSECEKCEFLLKPTNNCKKCGCFMNVKTKVATASCPIGKWGKEYNFIKGEKVATHPST